MKRFQLFKRKNSGNVARERLKQLLFHDRMSLSVDLSEKIHKDLIRCVSKYVEIDEKAVSIKFEKNKDTQDFVIRAILPVKTMKQRR